ncbi:MAG: hypothetical protein DIU54_015795 [Acidobacteriota bacterium]
MTFLELYGDQLDTILGSADRTQLFTTARRKAAINEAQKEFVRQTECLTSDEPIALVDGTRAYAIFDASSDDWWLARAGHTLSLNDGTTTRVVGEPEFRIHDEAWLDRHRPGWRNSDVTGQPTAACVRYLDQAAELVLDVIPDIPAGHTWTVTLRTVIAPPDMTDDGDGPFGVSASGAGPFEPWHLALAYYAASKLELLRRDATASREHREVFGAYVADFLAKRRTQEPRSVSYVHDYYRASRRHGFGQPPVDPRRWP